MIRMTTKVRLCFDEEFTGLFLSERFTSKQDDILICDPIEIKRVDLLSTMRLVEQLFGSASVEHDENPFVVIIVLISIEHYLTVQI
jgi:hypothetical protein